MDFRSMSDGELRRAHAMFLADPQSFANNPSYMHGLVAEHSRRFSQGNVDADLQAASTPIEPDPMAGQDLAMPYPPFNYGQYRTARQRARRGLGPEPMDSVETDAEVRARYDARYGEGAYDADAPGRAYRQGPNAPAWARPSGAPAPQQPLPPGYSDFAAGMAEAETGKTRAERLADADATDARWDRMKADYDRATGMPQPSGLAANDGYRDWSGWAPGQPLPEARSDFDGVMANRAQAEADRDARMKPMLDADKRDAEARAQWRADNPAAAENLAVNQRGRADDYRKERLLYRMAEQTGMSVEELRAANPEFASVGHRTVGGGIPTLTRTKDGMQMRDMPTSTSSMRDAAAQNRISEAQAREKAWRSQMMLAGNNPRKNAVNAWNALGDDGLNDWQRLTMAKALRPDIDGTSPLTVEANSAKNAMRLINADMVGQGGLGDTRAQMMQQKQRADAAAYADVQWAQKPYRARTTAARERLMRDIENRFGLGTGIVAAELEVNDTQAQQATGAQSTNPTQVGPPPNPINPSVPLAVPSRPPGV